ncbi:MAG: heavy metal transporter [Clostridiaceae bacterium]|nr:heavy metal transporter [Clostridiaceae bacterium]
MKRSYTIKNLGCANCAAKMENDIAKLDGVNSVRVNFMTSKIILDAEDDKFASLLSEAQKIVHKYEPYANILK